MLIGELTYSSIESITELSDGYLMNIILSKIDPQFFSVNTKYDWYKIREELQDFLE